MTLAFGDEPREGAGGEHPRRLELGEVWAPRLDREVVALGDRGERVIEDLPASLRIVWAGFAHRDVVERDGEIGDGLHW